MAAAVARAAAAAEEGTEGAATVAEARAGAERGARARGAVAREAARAAAVREAAGLRRRYRSNHLQRKGKQTETTQQGGKAGQDGAGQGMTGHVAEGGHRQCGPHRPQSRPQRWPCSHHHFSGRFARFK